MSTIYNQNGLTLTLTLQGMDTSSYIIVTICILHVKFSQEKLSAVP